MSVGACDGAGDWGGAGDLGCFVESTVLTDTALDMKVVREEIFGLASGIWTRDLNKAHRTAHRLRAGAVWINCYSVFDAAMPFGG